MYGDYEVTGELGKTTAGALYLARRASDRTPVVIKTLQLDDEFASRDHDDLRKRFLKEAEAARRLNHEGIRRILDAGEADGVAWLAMEWLDATPMDQFIDDYARLPADTVIRLIARAAEALGHAHGLGILHRDVQPARLLYDRQNDALKISDFGFARVPGSGRTTIGMVRGRLSYKSPEDLAGQRVTAASDLFSLGVTLYQLLSGKLPFEAKTMMGLMNQIMDGTHVPLSEQAPAVGSALDGWFEKALHKSPEQRFSSGLQMAETLRRCVGPLAA
jgi:serine/threonine-protein kinase